MKDFGYEFKSEFNEKYSLVTRRIVRQLSENSRISISEFSKAVSLSRKTVVDRMKKAEQEFGIQYTVEFNESMLGLVSPHLITVKFSSKPDYDHIASILRQSHIPQFAAACKGGYDLVIYAIATSTREYAHWDKEMQILLGTKFGVEWRPSEVVHRQLGFLPLRNEMLAKAQIPEKYRGMMNLLNTNARVSFQEMSKKLNMHFNTVSYNFSKLLKTSYIKRFTITMEKPKDMTLMSSFSRYKPTKDYESASANSRKAFMSDDDNSVVSRYLMTAPLIGSYDFFTLGAFDSPDAAYRYDIAYHKKTQQNQGVRMAYAEVDRVLLGRMPIRSVDDKKEYRPGKVGGRHKRVSG